MILWVGSMGRTQVAWLISTSYDTNWTHMNFQSVGGLSERLAGPGCPLSVSVAPALRVAIPGIAKLLFLTKWFLSPCGDSSLRRLAQVYSQICNDTSKWEQMLKSFLKPRLGSHTMLILPHCIGQRKSIASQIMEWEDKPTLDGSCNRVTLQMCVYRDGREHLTIFVNNLLQRMFKFYFYKSFQLG